MMIKELLARHCGGVREVHDNQFGFLCSGVRFGKTLSLTTDQLGILEDTVADPSSSALLKEMISSPEEPELMILNYFLLNNKAGL